jgi:abortive infection bacteriophage resistance protein
LYYRVFTAIPANIPQVDKFSERKLFASVMALGQLYPDADKWNNEFLPGMSALLAEYKNVILLRHIGYPKNWETVMRKQPGSGETDKPTVVLYLPPPPPTLRKEPAD